jgi:hypothetical protein
MSEYTGWDREHVWYSPATNELYIASHSAHILFLMMKDPNSNDVYLGEL